MKKQEIREIMRQAAEEKKVVNIFMCYNENYYNLIPLLVSDKLFLAINEDDFIFDGYRISRFVDVKKVRVKNDMCDQIIEKEGLISTIKIPNVKVDTWKSAFEGLKALSHNVIVERETAEEIDDKFTIGRIQKVCNDFVYVHHFDADGIWQDEPYKIKYSDITSVTFESRYVTIFSRYISEYISEPQQE